MLEEERQIIEIDADDLKKRFETEEVEVLKKAGAFRKFLDFIGSSTSLRILALALALVALFNPITFFLGVVSAVVNFGFIAYGIYHDVFRVQATREMQKNYALAKEIDSTSTTIEKMVNANPRFKELVTIINNPVVKSESTPTRELIGLNAALKTPELGLCYVFNILSLNPVIAAISSGIWITSMFSSSYSNVSYVKQMMDTENELFAMLEKRGLDMVSEEELVRAICEKRAQLIALNVVEIALTEDKQINIKKVYDAVYQEVLAENIKSFRLPETPTLRADLIKILFTSGFSGVESNKLYNPTYIPPEFQDIVYCAANKNMKIEVVKEEQEQDISGVEVGIGSPSLARLRLSSSTSLSLQNYQGSEPEVRIVYRNNSELLPLKVNDQVMRAR